jgi:uroporphyrinogen-III synthase
MLRLIQGNRITEEMPRTKHSDLPFAGMRVLIGRAQKQIGVLADLLSEFGATVTAIPFIEIRPPKSWAGLDRALGALSTYDCLILTSVNGVRALLSRMERLQIPLAKLSRVQITAIGPATRASLEKHGIMVAATPSEYVAEAVVEVLRDRVAGKRVLLVRAQEAREVIPRELGKAGAQVEVVAAYQTVLPAAARPRLEQILRDPKKRPHVVAFTSSSTVRNFGRLTAGMPLDGIRFVSIGPVTSQTMRGMGLTPHAEAREYNMAGIVGAIAELNLVV